MFEEIFEENKSKKKVRCIICQCWLPSNSDQVKASHVNGKSHKQKCEFKEKQSQTLKHSVYVKGFDPLTTNLETRLQELFEELGGGEVEDVYVDKNSAKYCFIKYTSESSVAEVLSKSHNVSLDGKKLFIKPRMQPSMQSEAAKKQEKSTTKKSKTPPSDSSIQATLNDIPKAIILMDQMSRFKEGFGLSQGDMEVRMLICQLLQSVLEEAYPNCQVKLFGSSANGLGCKGCDLDITVLSGESDDNLEQSTSILKEMREILERFAPGFKNIFLVESQKNCSIIKMYHTDSELNVDLSLNNRLAIFNTELLKAYICQDDTVQSFFFTVRAWAKMNNLIGRNAAQMTNYALMLMMIHFLQQHDPPYLLCLQDRHGNKLTKDMIGPWDCWFAKERTAVKSCIEDQGLLLLRFFKFAHEQLSSPKIIAIHTLKPLQKYQLHPELTRTVFITQDPFKLSHNVTQNITEDGLQNLQQVFTKILGRLESLKNFSLHEIIRKEAKLKVKAKSSHTSTKAFPTEEKPAQKTSKPSSNKEVFVIDLPQTSKDQNGCIEIVKKILTEDLKLIIQLSSPANSKDTMTKHQTLNKKRKIIDSTPFQPDSKKSKTMTESFGDYSQKAEKESSCPEDVEIQPLKGNETSMAASEITNNGAGSTKDDSIASNEKTIHLPNDTCISFTGIAYKETWTSRRKQRRMLAHSNFKSETVGNPLKSEDTSTSDTIADKNVNVGTSLVPEAINGVSDTTQEALKDDIKLNVKFEMTSVLKDNKRKLTMTLLQGDVKTYQMFFAYFKKKLINSFSVP
ncbi:speckle targeted PIP5K1A-regulated poly(A) polymerase-like [Clytia hemisphaerica]|uniref:RRM domain-containing protein n=1 Tax=Clytia hemisphaerica TaxID=252671 RepID=A0A7M5XCY1_9CNID